MLPIVREPDHEPPCQSCPKKSPDNDSLYRMNAVNRQCLRLFETIRACGGAVRLPDQLADDPEFWENMRIIDLAIKIGESQLRAAAYASAGQKSEE